MRVTPSARARAIASSLAGGGRTSIALPYQARLGRDRKPGGRQVARAGALRRFFMSPLLAIFVSIHSVSGAAT